MPNAREFKLNLKVTIPQLDPETKPAIVAYAFDSGERLLEKKIIGKKLEEKHIFTFKSERNNDRALIIIGPDLELESIDTSRCLARKMAHPHEPKQAITAKMVLAKGGMEARIALNQPEQIHEMILPKDLILKWLTCRCKVKGRLVKELEMPDGSIKKLGVCKACVFIWEVDSWPVIFRKLPERDLFKLRDDLHLVLEKWPRLPIPEPDPWRSGKITHLNPLELEPVRINPNTSPVFAAADEIRKKKIQELQPIFTARSTVLLRNEFIVLAELVLPLLCFIPWMYRLLRKDLLTCACTDSQGYFSREIKYLCFGDKPDLYFTAEQSIDGNWVTLHDPGLRCHVHWNYVCNSEVLLVTKEPGARVSYENNVLPPEGVVSWVEPHAIGGVILNGIDPADGTISYSFNDHPVTKAPFGATLGFSMGRSNDIPNADVYYYRILYQKDGESTWFESSEPVTRHYVHEENFKVSYPVVRLGPIAVNGKNLYRFKPEHPHDLDSSLDPAKDRWPSETWFGADIYSGYLNTTSFPGGFNVAHGLYTVKIEIYDSIGGLVDPDIASPRFQFIIPTGTDPATSTISTAPATGVNRDGKGFVFKLAIDNRSCAAAIAMPLINNIAQDAQNCGFLHYDTGGTITIGFTATHPGNNALFSFTLQRGNANPAAIGMSESYMEVATSLYLHPPGIYNNMNDGHFTSDSVPITNILETCVNAAFAESLYVYAKAFNGWDRIGWHEGRYYDASALNAFALSNTSS